MEIGNWKLMYLNFQFPVSSFCEFKYYKLEIGHYSMTYFLI